MKKFLLICLVASLPSCVWAFPGIDYTTGGAPFAGLMEQSFERDDLQNYELFNKRSKTVEEEKNKENELRQEAEEIQRMKKGTRIELDHSNYSNFGDGYESDKKDNFDMRLKNQNGKIFIKAE